MSWILWGVLGFVLAILIQRSLPVKGVENISASKLKSLISKKDKEARHFIDVRTPIEFRQYKVKPFKNIPLQNLRKQCDKLDRESEIILICRSGSRSMQAARVLKKAGFTNIRNVSGGLNQW